MIKVFNRKTNEYDIEKVAGDKYLTWCYESPLGKSLTELFIKKKAFSWAYGKFCDSYFSKGKIIAFINDFDIDMNECINSKDKFKSFNDFFIRKLKPSSRPVSKDISVLSSPGDGRIFAYEDINIEDLIQVKDINYNLSELVANKELANKYKNGTCIILRLCPVDYHRYHFVDNGLISDSVKIKGNYYSVNPIALDRIPKLYCQNKREYSIQKSENFGDILHIEVGATCVGSIIQSYKANTYVKKGDEKGYFKFGGSTTILFFEKNKIKIDNDIIKQSLLGFETKVLMGENIGKRL